MVITGLWFVTGNLPLEVATNTPTTNTPTAAPTPGTPTTAPTPRLPQAEVPPPPDWLPPRDWENLPTSGEAPAVLTANPLYEANFPVGNCPAPPPGFPTPESHTAYVRSLVDCLQELWHPYLAALGIKQEPVEVIAYDSKIDTPCGSHDPRFPAFYCSGNSTIYLSRRSSEHASKYPADAAETAIHEHFHHIQNQLGILQEAYGSFRSDDQWEISRRIELQDICMTSRLQLTVGKLGFGLEDYERTMRTFGRVGEEVHGSNKSLTYWGNRGFYMQKMGGCNTWTVPSEMVD